MKFEAGSTSPRRARGFTLAEVLASLAFMAIVIPVAIEGMHIASGAGERAARKTEAALVAEQVLNESVVTGDWSSGIQNGTVRQGVHEYSWTLNNQIWLQDVNQNDMRLISVEVNYMAQGRPYVMRLSTLVAEYQTTNQANPLQ
jgi:type II secretory pathway pseudopilin PulG